MSIQPALSPVFDESSADDDWAFAYQEEFTGGGVGEGNEHVLMNEERSSVSSTTVDPSESLGSDGEYDPSLYDDSIENLQVIAESMRNGVRDMLRKSGQVQFLDEVMTDVLHALWESMGRWRELEPQPPVRQWATGVYRYAVLTWQRTLLPKAYNSQKHTSYDVMLESGYENFEQMYVQRTSDPAQRKLYQLVRSAVIKAQGIGAWEKAEANIAHAQRGVNDRAYILGILNAISDLLPDE